jgi:hypothetical protein
MKVSKGRYADSVSFDGMCWPLPTPELMDFLSRGDNQACRAAVRVIAAYQQMIFDPLAKRQRVIRTLRAARHRGTTP